MAVAALTVWIIAAIGGVVMMGIWLARGGARTQQQASRLPAPLLFGHFALAAIGLVLWIIYMITDQSAWAWVAFALLILAALGGFVMFARWVPTYRARGTVAARSGPGTTGASPDLAEGHFPVTIVAGHGILAVATVILVLLAALEL